MRSSLLRRPSRLVIAIAGGLAFVGLILRIGGKARLLSRASPEKTNPSLALPVPYLNLDVGIRYVGDEACAACHPDIAGSFHAHPMSRSLVAVDTAHRPEHETTAAGGGNHFERQGFTWLVEDREGRIHHKEQRRDTEGRVLTELDAVVSFAVGSGTRGRTFLIQRDEYLFQSPISWFAQQGVWDLTPSLQIAEHFDRPVQVDCLFCHGNLVEPVEHTLNRYRPPLFRGLAIGCERCHGPGELHVASREHGEAMNGIDETIVNPRDLPPVLRDAVCQQCHLQGESRIVRRGRMLFDYRPGLPLHEFLTVFLRPTEFSENQRSGSHAAQMPLSRCFQASQGRLGCISCHDPHIEPQPASRVAYYRDRCFQCHQDRGCALPLETRVKQAGADDCAACHMPRARASNIAHTALTDHRILRRPEGAASSPGSLRSLRPGEIPLRAFHEDLLPPHEPDASRDLGIALAEFMRSYPTLEKHAGLLALPLLEEATTSWPDDVAAWESLGYVLWHQDRKNEAGAALEKALALAPERETSLTYAAVLADTMGRTEAAIGYWQRAVRVNPWTARYRYELARLLAAAGHWSEAVKEASAANRLSPGNDEARTLLISCYLHTQQGEKARKQFDILLALHPGDQDVLRRWFAEQQQ
jgi:predicted CXXCH cytochrome family protein